MTRKVTDLSVDELVALLAAHVRLIQEPPTRLRSQQFIENELNLAMMAAKVKE